MAAGYETRRISWFVNGHVAWRVARRSGGLATAEGMIRVGERGWLAVVA